MVKLHVQRTIDAPSERVFDWLADPANLATAPLALRAGQPGARVAPGW
jgi:hypothetical protein